MLELLLLLFKLKSQGEICRNEDFCRVEMPSEKNNILKFNQYAKFEKMPYIIYTDIEYLVKRIEGCTNNPQKSSIIKHIPCGCSMSTIWGFDHMNNKHSLYHGKDCMKKFCESLKEYATRIIVK